MSWLEDIIGLAGVASVGAGVWLRFGMDWSLIVVGSLLVFVAFRAASKGGQNAT